VVWGEEKNRGYLRLVSLLLRENANRIKNTEEKVWVAAPKYKQPTALGMTIRQTQTASVLIGNSLMHSLYAFTYFPNRLSPNVTQTNLFLYGTGHLALIR